ncbi:MAG: sulfite exporter TauE/SafE family protein [Desulfovibrionaceae bacterium]
MDAANSALVLGCFFLSAFLKGTSGLGFATSCLGVLACFLDVHLAIPLVLLPSVASNVLVMVRTRKVREAFRRFWSMYLCMCCGVPVGLWLLGSTSPAVPRGVLGAVMAVYGGWALLNPEFRIPDRTRGPLSLPTGFLTGLVNGLTGSQIMPALPYLLSLGIGKDLFVAAINLSFTIATALMVVGLGRMGLVTWPVLWVSLAGLPLVWLGVRLGSRLRERFSEAVFRRLVLSLLVVLGANLVYRAL